MPNNIALRSQNASPENRWPYDELELGYATHEKIAQQHTEIARKLGGDVHRVVGSLIALADGEKPFVKPSGAAFDVADARWMEEAYLHTYGDYGDSAPLVSNDTLYRQKWVMSQFGIVSDAVIGLAQQPDLGNGSADYHQLQRLRAFNQLTARGYSAGKFIDRAVLRPRREQLIETMIASIAENQYNVVATFPNHSNIRYSGAPITYGLSRETHAHAMFLDRTDPALRRRLQGSSAFGLALELKRGVKISGKFERENVRAIALRSYGFASRRAKTILSIPIRELSAGDNDQLLGVSAIALDHAAYRKETILNSLLTVPVSGGTRFVYRAQDDFMAAHERYLEGLYAVSPRRFEEYDLERFRLFKAEMDKLESSALAEQAKRAANRQIGRP